MSLLERLGSFFSPKKLSPEEEQTRRVAEQEKKAQKGGITNAERAVGRLDKMKEQDRIAESEEQVLSNQNQETKKDQQQQN